MCVRVRVRALPLSLCPVPVSSEMHRIHVYESRAHGTGAGDTDTDTGTGTDTDTHRVARVSCLHAARCDHVVDTVLPGDIQAAALAWVGEPVEVCVTRTHVQCVWTNGHTALCVQQLAGFLAAIGHPAEHAKVLPAQPHGLELRLDRRFGPGNPQTTTTAPPPPENAPEWTPSPSPSPSPGLLPALVWLLAALCMLQVGLKTLRVLGSTTDPHTACSTLARLWAVWSHNTGSPLVTAVCTLGTGLASWAAVAW